MMAFAPSRALFGGAVEVQHCLVDLGEGRRTSGRRSVGDLGVDVADRPQDPGSAEPGRVAVTQLDRFAGAGGRTRGHARMCPRTRRRG